MKRITALILSLLTALTVLPLYGFAARFDDVANERWYSEGISFCAANGYMTGTSDTVFDRNADLTRAMFMTILAKVDGADLAEYEGKSSFEDVKTDGWYTSAIEWAYQNKLASGMGFNKDGEIVFGYKNPVTREQMSTFLYGYAEYVNLKAEYGEDMPDVYPLPTPAPDSDAINKEPVYKSYEEVYAMIAGSNHRDIGELQSETQEMVSLGGYFSQYYQSYVSSTHDVRYVFVSSEEYEMEAAWDWLPVGTRDNYSLENLGKEVEDQSGLESFTPPIDTTLRADLSVFKDADRVHEWAKGSMEWAVGCGLFSGIGEGMLDPRGNCTRAQAAVLIRAFVLGFLCDCEHDWVMPTCLEGGYCKNCDLRYGYELGHDIPAHLCTDAQKCTRCEYIEPAKDHTLTVATCTEPSVCKVCNYQAAPATGHSYKDGTPNCTEPKKCVNCGYNVASALGHNYVAPTCTTYGYCTKCDFTRPALGHDTKNGFCGRCGQGIFEDIFHYLSYYADYNLTKRSIGGNSWSGGGSYLPCTVQYLNEGEERGWYMKDKDYDNVVYFCYGSCKNGVRTEVGIQIAPTESSLIKGEYTYYAYSYGNGSGFCKVGTLKASEMSEWMSDLQVNAALPYLFMPGLNEDYETAKARWQAEVNKTVTVYIKKALAFGKSRLAAKGMEVSLKNFGFVNY